MDIHYGDRLVSLSVELQGNKTYIGRVHDNGSVLQVTVTDCPEILSNGSCLVGQDASCFFQCGAVRQSPSMETEQSYAAIYVGLVGLGVLLVACMLFCIGYTAISRFEWDDKKESSLEPAPLVCAKVEPGEPVTHDPRTYNFCIGEPPGCWEITQSGPRRDEVDVAKGGGAVFDVGADLTSHSPFTTPISGRRKPMQLDAVDIQGGGGSFRRGNIDSTSNFPDGLPSPASSSRGHCHGSGYINQQQSSQIVMQAGHLGGGSHRTLSPQSSGFSQHNALRFAMDTRQESDAHDFVLGRHAGRDEWVRL